MAMYPPLQSCWPQCLKNLLLNLKKWQYHHCFSHLLMSQCLLSACLAGNVPVFTKLLEEDSADPNIVDEEGLSLLHNAVQVRDIDIKCILSPSVFFTGWSGGNLSSLAVPPLPSGELCGHSWADTLAPGLYTR